VLTKEVGKLVITQETAKGNVWSKHIAFKLSLTQFVELKNVRNQRPELRFEDITSLSKQRINAVTVIFKLGGCVVNAETHLGGLPFDTQLLKELIEIWIGSIVEYDKASVDRKRRALMFNINSGGVTPNVIIFFEYRYVVVLISIVHPGFVETPLTERNTFSMPMIISSEAATQRIVTGIAQGKSEIDFPRRFIMLMKLLRMLPTSVWQKLASRMV
jgi:hypothetical protein